MADARHVFKTVTTPPHHGDKMWHPSFWASIFGTSAGSSAGSNPLEARHAPWEAKLQSRNMYEGKTAGAVKEAGSIERNPVKIIHRNTGVNTDQDQDTTSWAFASPSAPVDKTRPQQTCVTTMSRSLASRCFQSCSLLAVFPCYCWLVFAKCRVEFGANALQGEQKAARSPGPRRHPVPQWCDAPLEPRCAHKIFCKSIRRLRGPLG